MRPVQPNSPFSGKTPPPAQAVPISLRTDIPPAERAFLAGTERRIQRILWAVSGLGTVACLLWKGPSWGAGFAVGAVISLIYFRWLHSAVNTLAESVASNTDQAASAPADAPRVQPGRGGIMARFIFRYALLGLAGYAIFLSSAISLKAFLLGLFVFVAGLMAEAVYQTFEATFGTNRDK